MTDSNRHNNDGSPNSEADRFVDQFPNKEQALIKTIWESSRLAKPSYTDISDDDVEDSLRQVHRRIQAGIKKDENNSNSSYRVDWRWIAAAASVLLILGTGYLLVPHKVEVSFAETRSIVLPDGSEVLLNSGSELQYNRLFSRLNRQVQLNGEAFFSVQNETLPFKVLANGSTVEVTGTAFNVRSWGDEPNALTEVAVQEGSVLFYPKGRSEQSVTLTAGLSSIWQQDLVEPSDPDSVSMEHAFGWKDQIFAFSKKPLGMILNELERRFDVQIKLEAEDYFNEQVTIYYVNPQSVEPILQDICRIKGLRFSEGARGYRLYE